MPSIGATSFITIQGQPHGPGMATEILSRPNVDGFLARHIGSRAEPFELEATVDLNGYGTVETYDALFRTLRGTLLSITSDIGNAYPNCLLINHRLVSAQKIVKAVGGINSNSDHVATFWFLFQYLGAY